MDGLNEVKLIGNVGKDVELRHLENDNLNQLPKNFIYKKL
jgi:single-stranded DNA-binding protein